MGPAQSRLEALEPRLMLAVSAVQTWTAPGNTAVVTLCDAVGGGGGVTAANLQVRFAAGNKVASITIRGSTPVSGLGIMITGAASVGSISDARSNISGDIAFIASIAPVGSISIKGGMTGAPLDGVTIGAFTFPADIDGDGNTRETTAIWSGGLIGSVKLGGSAAGDIVAADMGNVSIKRGNLDELRSSGGIGNVSQGGGAVLGAISAAAGNIGPVSVVGGNIFGAIEAPAGMLAGVTIKAVALTTAAAGVKSTEIVGSNLLGDITVGSGPKGKGLGAVSVTGGAIGTETTPVTITSVGDVGNLTSSGMNFTAYYADPAKNKTLSYRAYQAGGVNVLLTTSADSAGAVPATLGNIGLISVTGGNLAGTITSSMGGIAGITVLGKAAQEWDEGNAIMSGLVAGGNMTADVTAAAGPDGKGIGDIAVTGGALAGAIHAAGGIGAISNAGLAYKAFQAVTNPDTGATKVLSYKDYSPCELSADIISDSGSLGRLSVTGGDLTGQLSAPQGAIGAVAVKAVKPGSPDAPLAGGNASADLAALVITSVTTAGGDVSGTYAAGRIGPVLAASQKQNATYRTWKESDGAGGFTPMYDVTDGSLTGGNIAVTLNFTGQAADLGTFMAVGGQAQLDGVVPFDQPRQRQAGLAAGDLHRDLHAR